MSDTTATPDAVELLTADHSEVEQMFRQIESLPDGDVRHHVEEEEHELFPKLRASVTSAELKEMGSKLASAKKMAPSHPHPNAPNTPPGNIVGGVAAAMIDKARDAVKRD